MCAVNIRGQEANFYEARCHEAKIEAEARKSETEWFGLEATWASDGSLAAGMLAADRACQRSSFSLVSCGSAGAPFTWNTVKTSDIDQRSMWTLTQLANVGTQSKTDHDIILISTPSSIDLGLS